METTRELTAWLKRCWRGHAISSLQASPVKAWSLDYPSPNRKTRFVAGGRLVQGWVLFDEDETEFFTSSVDPCSFESIRVIATWNSVYELSHPLEVARPDVIERVLGSEPLKHAQLHCGFRFSIPHRVNEFQLWVCIGEQRWLLKDVNIEDKRDIPAPNVLKVLKGKKGWLFLDNDTNGSVDQYTGRLLLTPLGLNKWQSYLQALQEQASQQQAEYAILVAPSKESVMGPHYHPVADGAAGPIQQLLALPEAKCFVYPVPELMALGDDAFIQTDTHWAPLGALAATKALAMELGIDAMSIERLFVNDKYRLSPLVGDLGNKLEPKQRCRVRSLRSFSYRKHRYFDNGLPNIGRLLVLNNSKALLSGTCLIFGSSSAYSMFNYLCRIFQRIVFVHSAGTLDPELVAAVKPAYLVVQSNARFVIKVPKADQSLKQLIAEKSARLSYGDQSRVEKRQVHVSEDDAVIQALGLTPWVSILPFST